MGGRGAFVANDNAQIKMSAHIQRQEIESIQKIWNDYRAKTKDINGTISAGGIGGGVSGQTLKKKCCCCLQYTLPAYSEYEVCPDCGWIDDPNQNANIVLDKGSNPTSLEQARIRWRSQRK